MSRENHIAILSLLMYQFWKQWENLMEEINYFLFLIKSHTNRCLMTTRLVPFEATATH